MVEVMAIAWLVWVGSFVLLWVSLEQLTRADDDD